MPIHCEALSKSTGNLCPVIIAHQMIIISDLFIIQRDVENIDVYTGALSEPPMQGSIVGPLLSCLITDQFLRLKKGDSHWYERRRGQQKFSGGENKNRKKVNNLKSN